MVMAMTVRSVRKAKGHGAERRQEILDAALMLFAQRGILAVSTRDIAAATGISQPALYAYFRTRDEITAVLCEQAFLDLRTRILAAADHQLPTRASFMSMCQVYIDFGLQQPDAYRVAFMLEKGGSEPQETKARVIAAGVETFECFHGQVARLVAAGMTRPGEAVLLSQSLWAGLHGLVSLLIARPGFPWADHQVLISRHIAALADGVLLR